jgi:hypothetical protein
MTLLVSYRRFCPDSPRTLLNVYCGVFQVVAVGECRRQLFDMPHNPLFLAAFIVEWHSGGQRFDPARLHRGPPLEHDRFKLNRSCSNTNPRWDSHTGEARKQFFSEEKNQKTFALLVNAAGSNGTRCKQVKVFWFFFSKKNCFLGACLPWQ